MPIVGYFLIGGWIFSCIALILYFEWDNRRNEMPLPKENEVSWGYLDTIDAY